jgi:LacI family transcriptional regulator
MSNKPERLAHKRVTRADVARYAGVSTAVVSYVVNEGPKVVASATAQRVRDAIGLLDYRPNPNARALKVGTTGMLGLIVPDSSNPHFAEFALEIERAAAKRGLALVLGCSNSSEARESQLISDLTARQVDGVIVSSATRPHQRPDTGSGRSPWASTVWTDVSAPASGFRTIGSDHIAGAAIAVEHLLAHGHETVALLIGSDCDDREVGWQQALAARGRTPGAVVRETFTRDGGYRGGLRLLSGSPRPTAIFAGSDLLAVGLLRAAHELGLRIPEDVAIVSFDDTQESEYCWPPLTSIRQALRDMAEAAVSTVLDPDAPSGHQPFSVDLVVRCSCGCTELKSIASSRRQLIPEAASYQTEMARTEG